MKLNNKRTFSYVFIIILISFSLNSASLISKRSKFSKSENKNSHKNIDKKFLSSVINLKNFMVTKQGAYFKQLGLKFITKDNRYVIAQENIAQNAPIVKIPFKSLIHYGNPHVARFCLSLGVHEFTASTIETNQFRCLVLFMLFQLRKPSQEFRLYIETIPKSFNEYILFWPKADLDKIKNTFLMNLINSRMQEISFLNNVLKKSKIANLNFSINEIKHAHIAVSSRNFGLYIGKKLYYTCAPYTDLFNFDPVLNTTWTMRLKNENDFFILKATKNIRIGEQIFVNYGNDDNVQLLTGYGFTLKNNPFPASTNNFYVKFQNKFIWNPLHEQKSQLLVKAIEKLKGYENFKAAGKQAQRMQDLRLFNVLIQALGTYANKALIQILRGNLKQTPNTENIYRVLLTEDKLIDANLGYLRQFVEILNGGKNILSKYQGSRVVKQNLVYFSKVLD